MLWCVIERQRKNNNNNKQTKENKKSALQGLHTEQWAGITSALSFRKMSLHIHSFYQKNRLFFICMRLNFLHFFQEFETGMFVKHFLLLAIEARCFYSKSPQFKPQLKKWYIYLLFQCKFFLSMNVN